MCLYFFFVFKQKTAYELRISDWSSDVCSSDLAPTRGLPQTPAARGAPTLTLRDVAANFPALRSPAPSRRAESAAMTADQSPLSPPADAATLEIGSASCRERGCQYVLIPVVAVSLKKKEQNIKQ